MINKKYDHEKLVDFKLNFKNLKPPTHYVGGSIHETFSRIYAGPIPLKCYNSDVSLIKSTGEIISQNRTFFLPKMNKNN